MVSENSRPSSPDVIISNLSKSKQRDYIRLLGRWDANRRFLVQYQEDLGNFIGTHASNFDGEQGQVFDSLLFIDSIDPLVNACYWAKHLDILSQIEKIVPGYCSTLDQNHRDMLGAQQETLEGEVEGVSLSDILLNSQELVRKNPIATYAYFLESFSAYEEMHNTALGDNEIEFPILDLSSVYQVVVENPEQLKDSDLQLPDATTDTFIMILQTYKGVVKAAQDAFFDPNSKYFSDVVSLFTKITEKSDPVQMEHFLQGVLSLQSNSDLILNYNKLRKLIAGDKNSEFYEQFVEVVEDSFDGYKGEELYEYLKIEQDDEARVDEDLEKSLIKKFKQILAVSKAQRGSYTIEQGKDPEQMKTAYVTYNKDGKDTYVSVQFNFVNELGIFNAQLALIDNNLYWNILRTPDEIPEVFSYIGNIGLEHLNSVIDSQIINRNSAGPRSTRENDYVRKNPEHYRDPVYDLRKSKSDGALAETHDSGTSQGLSSGARRFEVVFPEHVLSELSPAKVMDANSAIQKYTKGLQGLKKLFPDEEIGLNKEDVYFRLRHRGTRVILRLEKGELKVVNVGDRKSIYDDRVKV